MEESQRRISEDGRRSSPEPKRVPLAFSVDAIMAKGPCKPRDRHMFSVDGILSRVDRSKRSPSPPDPSERLTPRNDNDDDGDSSGRESASSLSPTDHPVAPPPQNPFLHPADLGAPRWAPHGPLPWLHGATPLANGPPSEYNSF
mgnify:CR=1 FL=1